MTIKLPEIQKRKPFIKDYISTPEGRKLLAESLRYLAGKDPKGDEPFTLDCSFMRLFPSEE